MAKDETKGVKRKVPIREGLFKVSTNGQEGYLIGSKCRSCGEYFHPRRVVCANCYSEDMQEVALSRRGRIYTYTIARTGYPGAMVTPPFITAEVELPEKLHVVSLITGIDFDRVEIGREVELYFWKTGEDDQGNEVMAYAFRPISA